MKMYFSEWRKSSMYYCSVISNIISNIISNTISNIMSNTISNIIANIIYKQIIYIILWHDMATLSEYYHRIIVLKVRVRRPNNATDHALFSIISRGFPSRLHNYAKGVSRN